MRIFLIVLRVGVFLIALGGVGLAGYLGYLAYDNVVQKKQLDVALQNQAIYRALIGTPFASAKAQATTAEDVEKMITKNRLYPFLLGGAVLGLLGGILALMGRTTSGGLLLLVVGLGAGRSCLPPCS